MTNIQEPPRTNDNILTRNDPSSFGFGILGCIGYSSINHLSYGFDSSIRIERSAENYCRRNNEYAN